MDPKAAAVGRKTVTFDSVNFQEYAVILGDNPGVQRGPPITLDWTPQKSWKIDLEAYESAGIARRSTSELRMPSGVREQLIQDSATRSDIQRAVQDARKIKNQRQFSLAAAESFEGLEILCSSLVRKIKRTVRRSETKANTADPAELWMKQQRILTKSNNSRRATHPTLQLHKNTRRNSISMPLALEFLAAANANRDGSDGDSTLSTEESTKDEEATILAAAAHMTVE
jgi:hypothetical protein